MRGIARVLRRLALQAALLARRECIARQEWAPLSSSSTGCSNCLHHGFAAPRSLRQPVNSSAPSFRGFRIQHSPRLFHARWQHPTKWHEMASGIAASRQQCDFSGGSWMGVRLKKCESRNKSTPLWVTQLDYARFAVVSARLSFRIVSVYRSHTVACRILLLFCRQATFFPSSRVSAFCAARRPVFRVSRRAWRETEPTEAPCPGRHVPCPIASAFLRARESAG
jgi:hypothetical protein